MMKCLLLTIIAAFVSASEVEKEQRRIFCGGWCMLAIAVAVGGGAAAQAIQGPVPAPAPPAPAPAPAPKKSKRRRRMDGSVVDDVCTETMALVRAIPFLKDLLLKEGENNILPLEETVETVKEACAKLAETDTKMNQCTFYITAAEMIDVEILEGVWLSAYGNDQDQHHGCGRVVNVVNANIDKIPSVRRAELESNGQEVFMTGDESTTAFRRLIGATATGVMGAGMYLAHICRSFDESNNVIDSEEFIAWN